MPSRNNAEKMTFAAMNNQSPWSSAIPIWPTSATGCGCSPARNSSAGALPGCCCTLISAGHRRSQRAFHQRQLRLDGQGGWILQPIA